MTGTLFRDLLFSAAGGRFPEPDGSVGILPAPPGRSCAVVAFTAFSIVAADIDEPAVRSRMDPNDLGAATSPAFLDWLGGQIGSAPGMLDAVLVAPSSPAVTPVGLKEREDLLEHARVARALLYRTGVRVFEETSGAGIAIVGRGLAERWEVSVEVDPAARGRGLGRALAAAAALVPRAGEPVFAQVTPGNAASMRAFLAAGYRPICSEVLFLKP